MGLEAQRDPQDLEMLGVIATGLLGSPGFGPGGYYAGKSACKLLFTTKTQELLVNPVDQTRSDQTPK